MTQRLAHRGPDADGHWQSSDGRIALGHRRLSILDLSEAGAQPMHSHSARFCLSFNGEIYNFRSLRKQLLKNSVQFRGHSDTEVFLGAIEHYGVKQACELANGMFAFALFDAKTHELYLGRDRMGKKPLYYGWVGQRLVFASELKAFAAIESFDPQLDARSINAYLHLKATTGTHTAYRDVKKVAPGTVLRFPTRTVTHEPECIRYFSVAQLVETQLQRRFAGSPEEAVDQLEDILMHAVRVRMESDVPLGAFLSGGIDSSLVVALMQKLSPGRVRSFSIGFSEADYNEAHHAKAVAQELGSEHIEFYVSPTEAAAIIPELPRIYDEPFCDASQIPTTLVSRMAKKQVTVALSGDGGDELFLGYTRYQAAAQWWQRLARARQHPRLSRSLHRVCRTLQSPAERLPTQWAGHRDRLARLAELLGAREPSDFYGQLRSNWRGLARPVQGYGRFERLSPEARIPVGSFADFQELAAYEDTVGYLCDDILVKVDRASMDTSLEVRSPLLDHRVLAFAWSLPAELKRHHGLAKWPLQALVWRHVPRSIMDRPKMGFGVPIGEWIRGPLRAWAEDLLSPSSLRESGLLNVAAIRQTWTRHCQGPQRFSPEMWGVLMFQAWYRERPRFMGGA